MTARFDRNKVQRLLNCEPNQKSSDRLFQGDQKGLCNAREEKENEQKTQLNI